MKKSRAQLDREIAKALARAPHRRALGLSHSTQLANWWKKATPEEDHVCYATKTKALKAFLDTNHEVVQNYGGVDYAVSPSEFDAINHKYNLHGMKLRSRPTKSGTIEVSTTRTRASACVVGAVVA